MDLPKHLIDQVQKGRVVLFLGAGASKGAKNQHGDESPNGQELANLLAKKFLGPDFVDSPLTLVSELAVSEAGLFAVQDYIASIFRDLHPADFHLKLPNFRWRALVTINFDQIIEKCYKLNENRCQELVVFMSDRDSIDELQRKPDNLPLLKLHGCISRTRDEHLPLILTTEQYITYRKGREHLFNRLEEWGYEYPIVFIGAGLSDLNLREILMKLANIQSRPKYYLVTPKITVQEKNFWELRRISVLEGTYEEFLDTLEQEIPPHTRTLSAFVDPCTHPIERKFVTQDRTITEDTRNFIDYDVDFVSADLTTGTANPRAFYRGYNQEWAAISMELDVRRSLVDTVLLDLVLADENERPTNVEFCIIKAEAGAGKSVFLRRLAWETGREYEKFCLYLKCTGRLRYDPLYELATKVQERMFLVVDDAADRVQQLEEILIRAKRDKLRITIISAERVNEWNIYCERLKNYVTSSYNLPYLSEKEIGVLIDLLEKHQCLGHLAELSRAGRINAFVEQAGRQLLVALHETTQGKPFVDILVDEYQQIQPQRAQSIYLSICVLNRLGVPVRAGIIARVHEVPFETFSKNLFAPLEHVIEVHMDPITKDYLYRARHPLIAQIVFERILTDPEKRYDHYIRLLAALDTSYRSDQQAFRGMIRGRTLIDLFPDHRTVMEIFRVAREVAGDDSYLFHQMGIYEMRRPNGNLNKAQDYLAKAQELSRNDDKTITHSMAELARIRANRSSSIVEREHYRQRAIQLASTILDETHGSYGYSTMLQVCLDKIEELLNSDDTTDREIDTAFQEAEQTLSRGLQMFPEDPYLLDGEARLGVLTENDERVFNALRKAFNVNQRNPYIASRLAKVYIQRGQPEEAINVLEQALAGNPSDISLHFSLARILITNHSNKNIEKILYHLRRSWNPGDRNYEAQFWYATYLYMTEDQERMREAKDIFRRLRDLPMNIEIRTKVRFKISEEGKGKQFFGRLDRREGSYGFIRRDGIGDSLFVHSAYIDSELWKDLKAGDFVTFEIGFNFGGPLCIELRRLLFSPLNKLEKKYEHARMGNRG